MLNTTKGQKAICLFDPAITQAGTKVLMEYARDRKFAVLEPYIKRGDPPIIYHFTRLSRSTMDRFVDVQPSGEGKWVAAFQYGIVKIEKLRQEDGSRIDWEPTGTVRGPDGDGKMITDEEMNAGIVSRAEMQEIGNVIYFHSHLPPWLAGCFLPPPMSLELLTRPGRSAAASLSTAPPSNSKPSGTVSATSGLTELDSEGSASKSESPTDATAEASLKKAESAQA